jgi:Sulfotransferase family
MIRSGRVNTASLTRVPVRFVFIIGTGRCGSTLVQQVLAGHPQVGFISNADERLRAFSPSGRWNGPLYRGLHPRGRLAPRDGRGRLAGAVAASIAWTRTRVAPTEAWLMLDEQVSPAISLPCRDLRAEDAAPWLADRFRRFYMDRATAQGRPVFMHKFTGWPRAGFIQSVLPSARFIHIVRDGRSVANSLLQMPWWSGYRGPSEWSFGPLPDRYAGEWESSARSFAVLAAIEWKLLIDAFADARAAVPDDQWLELRYEDFVSDPRGRTSELLAFAGLGWEAAFESQFAAIQVHPAQGAFRNQLSGQDLELLEVVLGEHLTRLGYRTEGAAGVGDAPASSPANSS